KQLNLLRDRYSLRNTNVEPRVFTMIEANGIRVSIWYQTNAYATLPLHSTICGEIIDAIKNEDDITIAYPTTTIRAPKDAPPSDGAVPQTQLHAGDA
ncbi:MAG: mechanosensitive ion channel family protein, partial [Helicobacter sp.]|nr:mechanosensitive ion channel family protein [Helicobacter sp.]